MKIGQECELSKRLRCRGRIRSVFQDNVAEQLLATRLIENIAVADQGWFQLIYLLKLTFERFNRQQVLIECPHRRLRHKRFLQTASESTPLFPPLSR